MVKTEQFSLKKSKSCCVLSLFTLHCGMDEVQKHKQNMKMHISHFQQAGSLPLAVSWRSNGENTVCAFKDFVLNRQICWN